MLGPELITNGNFATGTFDPDEGFDVADHWGGLGTAPFGASSNANGHWVWTPGKVTYTGTSNDNSISNDYGSLYQTTNFDPTPTGHVDTGLIVNNKTYQIQFTISGSNNLPNRYIYSALGEILSFDSSRFVFPAVDGTVTYYAVAHANFGDNSGGVGVQGVFFWIYYDDVVLSITNVSVKEVLSGLSLGNELITNGGFSGSASGWTLGTQWHYGYNQIVKLSNSGFGSQLAANQTIGLAANKSYFISITANTASGSDPDLIRDQVVILSDDDFYSDDVDPRTPQISHFIVSTSDDGGIFFQPFSTGLFSLNTSHDYKGSINNISVREVQGLGNESLKTIYMVGAEIAGDIQTINAGKSDDGNPIYYELETRELEFNNRASLKKISDKIAVFGNLTDATELKARQDDGDYKQIPLGMEKEVNIGKDIDLEGHYFTFKLSGQTDSQTPVFEGLTIENINDMGITNG